MASKRLKKKALKKKENILVHKETEHLPTFKVAEESSQGQIMGKEDVNMSKEETKKGSAKKTMIYFQFQGKEIEEQEVIGMVKKVWKDQGNMMKDLKDLSVYIKAEESKVYYVINGNVSGSIDL